MYELSLTFKIIHALLIHLKLDFSALWPMHRKIRGKKEKKNESNGRPTVKGIENNKENSLTLLQLYIGKVLYQPSH